MRKSLISILTLICFFLPTLGQEAANSLSIGYCNGENGSMGDITSSNAKSLSAGILIPSGMIESLTGNRVESIRVYLPSKLNITSLTAWVRRSLDGENLAQATLKAKELDKGWNDIALETPFELTDTEPFYIGYTFEQKSRAYAICCTGFYVEGGLYYRYDDGDWETDSKFGNLCVEGIVTGDKLPQYDLELNYVSMPPIYYAGDKFAVKMGVTNHAVATVNGFTLSYSVAGVFDAEEHIACHLSAGESADFTLELSPVDLPEGEEVNMIFTISALDDGMDEAPGNNTKTLIVSTADNKFKKVVLVEEFTTEKCGNCPGAAPKVYGAIAQFNEEHPGSVTMICHHAGFYTDFLTSEFDETYIYLFGGGSFAPAAMVDRYASDGVVPVFGISTQSQIYDKIVEAYHRPVNYALEADLAFDEESKTLNVQVNGSRTVDEDVTPTRVSVVVVENNIPQQKQSGAEGDYVHQHVMRTANSAWGDVIDWEGYNFDYSCRLNIDEAWNKDNLEVIVYINQYDKNNEAKCYVENARVAPFPGHTSVNSVAESMDDVKINVIDGRLSVEAPYNLLGVWSPSGMRVSERDLARGLYLVKVGVSGKTVTRKIFVR